MTKANIHLRSIFVGLAFALVSGCRPEVEGTYSSKVLSLINAVGKNDKATIAVLTRHLPLNYQENLRFLNLRGCLLERIVTLEQPGADKIIPKESGEVIASWKCPLHNVQVRTVSFTVEAGEITQIDPHIHE